LQFRRSSAALALALGVAFACTNSPTASEDAPAPRLAKPTCPGHPSCNDPPPSGDQVDLDLTLSDGDGSAGDALAGDGQGAYQEGFQGVGAHLSGANGNLMFDVDQYSSGPRRVEIDLGASGVWPEAITRIYTNNSDEPDLRDMEAGESTTARLFVEWQDGRTKYDLRFGTNCLGDKFNAGPNDDVDTRVNIDNVGNWIVTPTGNAFLCLLKKGNKPPDETLIINPAFTITMVRQP
jgi:hypothetical protein